MMARPQPQRKARLFVPEGHERIEAGGAAGFGGRQGFALLHRGAEDQV